MRKLVLALSLAVGLSSCAHGPHLSRIDDLKKAVYDFYQRVRWNDFVGTGQMLDAPLRGPFFIARDKLHDEKDLSITDYEILDVELLPDRRHGFALVKVSWTRLPSVSVTSATANTQFEYENDAWVVKRMVGGPFNPELAPPLQDAGTPAAPAPAP